MRKPNLSKLASVGCSVALVASMCAPVAAFADDGATNTRDSAMTMQYVKTLTGDEEVPLDPTDSIGVKVPSTIPLAYRTDGSIVGPTADVYRIENNGIKDVYLDSNAIWGLGTKTFGWGPSRQTAFAINGAYTGNTYDGIIDIALDLEFDDEAATKTTTYDPNATVTDGKSAITAGHPEVDGSILEANNIAISRNDSLGCDFTGTLSLSGRASTEHDFISAFANASTQNIGTITWSFNTDVEDAD